LPERLPAAFKTVFLFLLLSACADLNTAKINMTARRYDAARADFEYLAAHGFPQGQTKLGEMYQDGMGVPPDPAKALALFHQAEATENYPPAILDIGKAYRNGEGVRQNAATAKKYYQRALDLGCIQAYVQLGLLEQDARKFDSAARWFGIGLAHGDTGAWYAFGNLHIEQHKLKEAENDFKNSLAAGDDMAWFGFGRVHALQGKYAQAESDFLKAYQATGQADAFVQIGEVQLLEHKYAAAETSYKQALAAGIPRAALKIGALYRDGMGRPVDGAKALFWFYRAHAMGAPDTDIKIMRAERKLQPEQLAEALKQFHVWQKGGEK